jgi:hypothetical protein
LENRLDEFLRYILHGIATWNGRVLGKQRMGFDDNMKFIA